MASGRGKKFNNKGSLNQQSSSRIIEKRSGKGNKQQASMFNSNSLFIPTAALDTAFATAYPNVHAFASAPVSTASCDWAAIPGETIPCGDKIYGYIFMCNGKTKADCYKYRVFGLPAARIEVVEKIMPHMKLFLFDFDLKLLYGIYTAASNGKLAIEPTAFGGRFSAQVRFEIFKDCLPLPESAFKHVIKDNYRGGSKFSQELSDEQVANLISLFRPIAVPPVTAVSLIPNALSLGKTISPSIDARIPHAAELSTSYDQYLAGRARALIASAANMACLQPAVDSMHLPPVVPQRQCDLYYPPGVHQAYIPENPALYSRYTSVPDDSHQSGIIPQSCATNNYYDHNTVLATTNAAVQAIAIVPSQFSTPVHGPAYLPSSSLTAAYWAQVAAENPKQFYSSHQTMPSGSTGVGGQYVPVTSVGAAPTYPAVTENRDRETVLQSDIVNDCNHNLALAATSAPVQAQYSALLQFQAPLLGPVHSSSLPIAPAYWTAVASEDSKQVYSGLDQKVPSGGTGLGAKNVHVSFSGAAPSYTSLPEKSERETVSQLGFAYGYPHNMAVSSTNVPLQAHVHVPSQVPAPLHGLVHPPSSMDGAAYWTMVASEGPNQVYSAPHQRLSS